ncbi:MAG: hypothetical protein L0Y66_20795 [Myxococcaceae bacterium]|nr:hypothetical protein [Myxococcaceae bacterium]MCI0672682.1 hypothetical protein [Myxococcaceae bacterium]
MGPDQLYRPQTPEQAREAVRETARRHPELVKLWLDDFHGSLPVKMSPEVYSAIIDEAHRQGLRVAAHVWKRADFIVVQGNPAVDIRDVHRIAAVWHRGTQVSGAVGEDAP